MPIGLFFVQPSFFWMLTENKINEEQSFQRKSKEYIKIDENIPEKLKIDGDLILKTEKQENEYIVKVKVNDSFDLFIIQSKVRFF